MRSWRALFVALAGFLTLAGLDQLLPPPLEAAGARSFMVSDRTGKPLRAFPTAQGRWRFSANLDAIDPRFIDAVLQVEDKRFFSHPGVDPLAMGRAVASYLRAGRIVSGGSTITMQTARLLEPRPRRISSKLIEIVRAFQLERRLTKREILELYLTLTPYGGNLEGVTAASWAWLGRGPDHLSDDQIAFLIALPQNPEGRRPDRHPDAFRAGRARVTEKLIANGFFASDRRSDIASAPVPKRRPFPALAWHGAQNVARVAGRNDVRSTLDAALQRDLEEMLGAHVSLLEPAVQAAALVIDIPSRGVRAAVGSADRMRPGGWLDLTRHARSPGSTLKPFIYGVSFDDGHTAPETQIIDLPKRFAAYQPENFDRSFRGDVTIAEALQHSLNVPAVLVMDRLGPERFAAMLSHVGATPRVPGAAGETPGLSLALGGAGLTLQELGVLYAALGDGGRARPLNWQVDEARTDAPGQRLMSGPSAAAIIDILKAAPAPAGRLPGRLSRNAPEIAFKTGTSYGYRDALAAGIAGDLAILVWVGRPDGAPRPGKTGRTAALPLLFQIADRAAARLGHSERRAARLYHSPQTSPGAGQAIFSDHTAPPEILFPPKNAELWAGDVDGAPARPFVLAGRGDGRLRWFVDGEPCLRDAAGLPIWHPQEEGFYKVTAVDPAGLSSHVQVRVLVHPAP